MLNYFGGKILNKIGGTFRWMLGSISSKNKFTFKDYIYGPKNSDDYFDQMGHQFNNKWIGLFIIIIIALIIKVFI
jgi:hypothetical protein